MERDYLKQLIAWRNIKNAKPLIIKGARQVGKTWLMKYLGKHEFQNFIYVNFEKEPSLKNIFQSDLKTERIIKSLEIQSNQTVKANETLLILDEIQEAPKALTSLKYFAEDKPGLHVIAAGSLLGISLDIGSFPVGKVDFLNVFPMSFKEFLKATGQNELLGLLLENDFELISIFKHKFVDALKTYYWVGGMPEAVLTYVKNNTDIKKVRKIQSSILQAYMQDFAKHAPPNLIPKIISIWESLVSQLSKENKKFVYGLVKSGARAREYEGAIDWLVNYGLVNKIHVINKVGFPLKAYEDLKSFKLFAFDTGLLSNMANLDPSVILSNDSFFQEFKGAITEQFVQQEFKFMEIENLNYWSNKSATAEVDFIFEHQGKIYPIEVKANENLQSKSLKVFHNKYPKIHCYRTSLSNFRQDDWLTNLPLYTLSGLFNEK